jgi:hypothetical protein
VQAGPPAAAQAEALRAEAAQAASRGAPGGIFGPQAPQTANAPRKLSPRGEDALRQLQELQQEEEKKAAKEQEEEERKKEPKTAASTAESLAGPPKGESDIEKGLRNLDEFDAYTLRQSMLRDIINNDDQRELIEARLAPLSLSEYLMKGRVTQIIDIDPKDFILELQSLTAEEEQALKRLLSNSVKDLPDAPDKYHLERYSIMGITAALVRINQKRFPTHFDAKGRFNDELFWLKFEQVIQLPFHLLAAVAVQNVWFDARVRSLVRVKNLKNGS